MGVAERRLREKEQRQKSIIEAAEKVFFSKGVDTATMDEVAETAELSKGLLYFYFKSKEDLVHAICHRGLHVLRQFFEDVLQTHDRGIDQVLGMGKAYVRFAQEYPDYFDLMVRFEAEPTDTPDPDSYEAICRQEGDKDIELVAQAVQNGIDDGTVRSDVDPLETALMLWGQTHGLIQIVNFKAAHRFKDIDSDHLLNSALRIMQQALEPR